MQSRKKGIAISYITLITKTLLRFVLTHLYLRVLGSEQYGFYQFIYSIAAYATILDFGISSVINKFGIEKKEKGDIDGYRNVLFYALMISIFATALILIIGTVIFLNASSLYHLTDNGDIKMAKFLIVFIIFNLVLLLFEHYFEGIILAEEKYTTLKTIGFIQVLLQGIFILILLFLKRSVKAIAVGDFLSTAVCVSLEFVISFFLYKKRPKFYSWDKVLFWAIFKLASALCLQSIILYLNTTIDKYVIGLLIGKSAVTIYTLAVTFSTFFDEIPTIVQRLYLPQAVKLVARGGTPEEITDFAIKPGRFQFMLCCAMLGGFLLFGRHFIVLWSGVENVDSWWIAILLMAPSLLPLIQNTLLAILTAKNLRMFRSLTLLFVAFSNLVLTIFLVRWFGIIGASVGTFVALILGNNIAMNMYYKIKLKIRITHLFASIFKGILLSGVLSTVVCIPLTFYSNQSIWWLLSKCLIFIIVYFIHLYCFGLNENEKTMAKRLACKLLRKKKV